MAALLLLTAGSTWAQDKLVRYDEKAFEKLAKEMNEDKSNPYVSSWAKDVFRSYCELESVKVGFTEKDYQDANQALEAAEEKCVKSRKQLADSLGRVIDTKDHEILRFKAGGNLTAEKDKTISDLESRLAKKENQIKELTKDLDSLRTKNSELEVVKMKYEKAFEDITSDIKKIYEVNKIKHLVDMDVKELAKAGNVWDGMKGLIEKANPQLAQELGREVGEINQWKSAVEPMQGAIAYMKGRYDDEKRSEWFEILKNLKLTGDKNEELNNALTALKKQDKVHDNYEIIIDKLEEKKSLPDTMALNSARKVFETVKGYNNIYNLDYFESYNTAIKDIEKELYPKDNEPSERVANLDQFKEFIESLKKKF